jgi:hypothetical protein
MEKLTWLLQCNGIASDDFQTFRNALDAEGLPYTKVKVLPFSTTIEGLPQGHKDRPSVVYGSITLCRIARDKKYWNPGCWWNDNFSYEVQKPIFGSEMLNYEGEVYPFKDVPQYGGDRFIRPVDDGKAFAGMIIGWNRFKAWRDRCIEYETDVTEDTRVVIAPLQPIWMEYRFFVVDKKVVTGSTCWKEDRIYKRELTVRANTSQNVINYHDQLAWDYAQEQVLKWQPAPVFVIDVAVLKDDSTRIIEINCANGSGIYKSDVRAFVRAVENMPR